jgi:membrane-associated protease RseP (regulator of RpoE activity)
VDRFTPPFFLTAMSNPTSGEKTWLNGLLFVLTLLTLCYAGTGWSGSFIYADLAVGGDLLTAPARVLHDPRLFPLGALYAVVLMIILAGHESGHYLTCRRYRVRATLPYFLPGPPVLGTFGAFIRIKSPLYFRRQVFDIGAAGPLVGFALTLPVLAAGLALSKVAPRFPSESVLSFGEPLLFKLMSRLFVGPIPAGSGLVLHPVGWAGWVGLLVTALNLLPIGQLDGGHIAYALLGRKAWTLSRIMIGVLVLMGLFFFATWLVLAAVLLVAAFKWRASLSHPPVIDEGAPLGTKRTILAAVIVLIFVLSFVPDPSQGYGLIDLLKGTAGPF